MLRAHHTGVLIKQISQRHTLQILQHFLVQMTPQIAIQKTIEPQIRRLLN